MAKVKVLVGVVASGFDCKAGGEYDLTDEDATMLIRMGKAVPVEASTKKNNESRRCAQNYKTRQIRQSNGSRRIGRIF